MLLDARSLSHGTSLETDVCIVGGGPAGIVLAIELAQQGLRVTIAEAGSQDYSEESQTFYDGHVNNHNYPPLNACRLRYFGGSSNHWAGNCSRLDAADFQARSWVQYSGWPFQLNDLAPYYDRAASYLQLPSLPADDLSQFAIPTKLGIHFDPNKVAYGLALQSPPTRFANAYQDLLSSLDVRVLLNATAVEIRLNSELNSVAELKLRSTPLQVLSIKAKIYVLAAGGIENARLLLLSNRQLTAGIGNQHDNVGRYFMDHPVIEGAWFIPTHLPSALPDSSDSNIIAFVKISDATVLRQKMLNVRIPFVPSSRLVLSQGIESMHQILDSLQEWSLDDDFLFHAQSVFRDLDLVLSEVGARYFGLAKGEDSSAIRGYVLDTMIESRPDPNNRIVLGEDLDPFGQRKVRLTWTIDRQDIENLKLAYMILATELGRQGRGRIVLRFEHDSANRLLESLLSFGNHHMGTTRAAEDQRSGVVDSDLKLFGATNLFITGSSVFPTSGCVPPTFTITALSIRLADHIRAYIHAL
jgi:choline dehydrogenase-like flavoprotein